MWLKRRTPQNIVIGGAAGAFPPMIGWAAVTGSRQHREHRCCSSSSSCGRRRTSGRWRSTAARDYERAGVPMLPVVAGPDETRKQIVIYSLAAGAAGLLPAFIGLGGAALRAGLDRPRRRLPGAGAQRLPRRARAAQATAPPSSCSAFSILYLFRCSPRCSSSGALRAWLGVSEREARHVADERADEERQRRRKMRSIAIALALAALVVLFYVATIVRLGGNVLNRPL